MIRTVLATALALSLSAAGPATSWDFEQGTLTPERSWSARSDQIAAGSSYLLVRIEKDGANHFLHINGEVTRSCQVPLNSLKAGDKIVTIEGLSANSSHPVQKAWASVDVPQCGYCQSGQIMAAAALLKKKPKPTDADIDEAMTNICRCGTYQRIREAVHVAAGNPTTGRAADRAPNRT